MDNENQRPMTFGEKAVGLTFNPSDNAHVTQVKSKCAELIDYLDQLRTQSQDGEVRRMAAVAITELQTAQMWAVKAITWKAN